LSPCFSARTNAIEYSDSLAGQFTPLVGGPEIENGLEPTIIMPATWRAFIASLVVDVTWANVCSQT
jgi:hypothetical protein